MNIKWTIPFLLVSAAFGQSTAKTMTNADVIDLVKNGLGEDIVIADIETAPSTQFDTTVDGLKSLQAAHVPVAVIKAMMEPKNPARAAANQFYAAPGNDPDAPHHPGIYLYEGSDGKPTLTELQGERSSGAQGTGAFVHALTQGIAKMKVKSVVDGPTSPVKTQDTNPTFYFYYVETPGMFGASELKPSDFTLLKFEQKKGKREITTMSSNIVSSSTGTDEHAKRAFTAEKVKAGEYRLTLTAPLAAGEYAFQWSDGLFYTFSVQPKP